MADAAPPLTECLCRHCGATFLASFPLPHKPKTVCHACTAYRAKINSLRRKFNLSEAEFRQMNQQQNHCCAICRLPAAQNRSATLYVDHCHTTGRIRGLLCQACNTAIALLRDCPETIRAAALYLENNDNRSIAA